MRAYFPLLSFPLGLVPLLSFEDLAAPIPPQLATEPAMSSTHAGYGWAQGLDEIVSAFQAEFIAVTLSTATNSSWASDCYIHFTFDFSNLTDALIQIDLQLVHSY